MHRLKYDGCMRSAKDILSDGFATIQPVPLNRLVGAGKRLALNTTLNQGSGLTNKFRSTLVRNDAITNGVSHTESVITDYLHTDLMEQ